MHLSELLAQDELGLRLVDRPLPHDPVLTGAHAIELVDAGRWIAPGYVVLTTGLMLRGRVQRQREFVESLADARAAAVGFGVGVSFADVPAALVGAAADRALPLFAVPLETAFRDIIRLVLGSTLNDDLRQFGRAIALEDYLMGAVDVPAAEQELAERLRELLHADVAVFAASGSVVAAAGDTDPGALWAAVATGRGVVVGPGGSVFTAAVRVRARLRYHLAAAIERDEATDTLVRPLVRFAVRVLQMIAVGRDSEAEQRRAERAKLLDALLDGVATTDLLAGLAAAAFDERAPLHLLVARAAGGDADAELANAIDRLLEERDAPRAVTVRRGSAVALWQRSELGDELLDVAAADGPLAVGIATPFTGLDRIARAVAEARAAWLAAERAGGGLASFGSGGLAELVLGSADDADAIAARVLDPVRAAGGDLLATLDTFFAHDLDVASTARQLHLHPNSVRYRLGRIETVLGRSLRSPATITELYLALQAEHGRASRAAPLLGLSQT